MKKYFGKSRYEVTPLFMKTYSLSDEDWSKLTQLWYDYGMRYDYCPQRRTPANHYFLQGILEHLTVEWNTWEFKMHPELKEIIKKSFPQLMVTDHEFDID